VIKIKYSLDYNEHLAAQYLHLRPRPVLKIVSVVIILLFVIVFALVWSGPRELKTMDYLVPGFVIYMLLYYFAFLPYRIKKIFRQNKFRAHENEMEIDVDGIHNKSDLGQDRLPWDHFLKWKENKKMILLYIVETQYLVFPRRLFVSQQDWDELRKLLTERVQKMN
jgi:hypothetical protein